MDVDQETVEVGAVEKSRWSQWQASGGGGSGGGGGGGRGGGRIGVSGTGGGHSLLSCLKLTLFTCALLLITLILPCPYPSSPGRTSH